ncbi:hypothetical protein CAP40_09950 [Sphingomonas sp. IBVSS2]|uniref:sensor histidine kinase n=1 Tax=Sphingomonas sp. IBVSS2 TaxID=1985172 RepID=UPI000A2E917A|nr:HAMP domain-containing sensor histidine kinase [Sphingomonas sp. IBVSS2]OSZ68839.1 hypothetical protein CAP40_09950 [Sphingomonas sp. IBVSS2]
MFWQLFLSQVVLVLFLAVFLPMLLGYLLSTTADQFVADKLRHEALIIATGSPIRSQAGGFTFEGRFGVADTGGLDFESSSGPPPIPSADLQRGDTPIFFKYGRYDVLTLPAPRPGRQEWIVVAQDRTFPNHIVDDIVTTFLERSGWIVPASLFASLIIGLLILGRVTGRFRRMARQADAIGLDHIGHRLEPTSVPLEAVPLVHATNHALDRLEAGYRFQGEFIGNVAHELRTPLALISLRLEALDPSPERDAVQLGVERANRVVQQLMDLAIVDRHHPGVEIFDPVALAGEVVSVMAPLALRRDHDINFTAPTGVHSWVEGIPGLVQIALTNLIDNAVRHTPAGCTVSVRVEQDGSMVVADDGPGFTVEVVANQIKRYRKEGANRTDSAGLGLSIVERIMTACGGSLKIDNLAPNGTRCVVRLRAVPPPPDTVAPGSPAQQRRKQAWRLVQRSIATPDADRDAGRGAPGSI